MRSAHVCALWNRSTNAGPRRTYSAEGSTSSALDWGRNVTVTSLPVCYDAADHLHDHEHQAEAQRQRQLPLHLANVASCRGNWSDCEALRDGGAGGAEIMCRAGQQITKHRRQAHAPI